MKDKVIFRRVGKSWTIGFFRCPKCQAMMPKVIETIKQEVSAFNIEEVLEHSQTCSSCGITLEFLEHWAISKIVDLNVFLRVLYCNLDDEEVKEFALNIVKEMGLYNENFERLWKEKLLIYRW